MHNKNVNKRTSDLQGSSIEEIILFFYCKKYFPDTKNRYKLIDGDGVINEADIFIESQKIVIEYDGLFWHKKKEDKDNEKNAFFNKLGYFVVRVREDGLPSLNNFDGCIINRIPKENDKFLMEMLNNTLKCILSHSNSKLNNNETIISYDEYLNDLPEIESMLFFVEKENCFAEQISYKYWDFQKNKNLKANNISRDNYCYAWFIGPCGRRVLRNTCYLYAKQEEATSGNTNLDYTLFSLCPFFHNGGGKFSNEDQCLSHNCDYLEKKVILLIDNFISNGCKFEELDCRYLDWVHYFPRALFLIINKYLQSDENGRKKIDKVFSKYADGSTSNGFTFWYVKLIDVSEIDVIFSYLSLYPENSISFNLDIFDTNENSKILINAIEKFMVKHKNFEIANIISDNNTDISDKLMKSIIKLADKNCQYLDEFHFGRH